MQRGEFEGGGPEAVQRCHARASIMKQRSGANTHTPTPPTQVTQSHHPPPPESAKLIIDDGRDDRDDDRDDERDNEAFMASK